MRGPALPLDRQQKHAASSPILRAAGRNFKGSSNAERLGKDTAILLQGFGWSSHETNGWWKIIQQNVQTVKDAGFTHIWLPPPSRSVAPQGYMPGQYYNLNSSYGSPDELRAAVAEIKKAGLAPMCDIVINHRCADSQDDSGVWNKYEDGGVPENDLDWGTWAITSDDPDFKGQGSKDTGADFGAAPDLDHTNPRLREALKKWLNWLKDDIGFEGWRFDFAKGYGAEFVAEYCQGTVGTAVLNVGEFWTDAKWGAGGILDYDQNMPRQQLCDWLDAAGGCCVFDFVSKGIFNEAFGKNEMWRLIGPDGKQPGSSGWWPSRSVNFIGNHDTDSSQGHWPFPSGKEPTGYAYILTHPGIPCVMWEHLMDYGHKDVISGLINVRKRNGINSRSKLDIQRAEADIYIGKVDDKLIVKLGPNNDMRDLTPREEDGWKIAMTGQDFAIWEK
ncbi:hypothetical protein WJX84_007385 [Apatococcus fuscideae]|uniref:alpha-amylase n=1 Tax=Apatococcus fuscideae TaxID=2026836 RepID=A0AAW1T4N7_9CHLO